MFGTDKKIFGALPPGRLTLPELELVLKPTIAHLPLEDTDARLEEGTPQQVVVLGAVGVVVVLGVVVLWDQQQ